MIYNSHWIILIHLSLIRTEEHSWRRKSDPLYPPVWGTTPPQPQQLVTGWKRPLNWKKTNLTESKHMTPNFIWKSTTSRGKVLLIGEADSSVQLWTKLCAGKRWQPTADVLLLPLSAEIGSIFSLSHFYMIAGLNLEMTATEKILRKQIWLRSA